MAKRLNRNHYELFWNRFGTVLPHILFALVLLGPLPPPEPTRIGLPAPPAAIVSGLRVSWMPNGKALLEWAGLGVACVTRYRAGLRFEYGCAGVTQMLIPPEETGPTSAEHFPAAGDIYAVSGPQVVLGPLPHWTWLPVVGRR